MEPFSICSAGAPLSRELTADPFAASISTSCLYLAAQSDCTGRHGVSLTLHHLMGFGSCHVGTIMNNAAVNTCVHIFLLGKHLGMEFLGLYLTFSSCQASESKNILPPSTTD